MDKFYKIRHKATGLFFKPSSDTFGINLSKQGKVYGRKPPLKSFIDSKFRLGFGKIGQKRDYRTPKETEIIEIFNLQDWELVEFYTVSKETGW